MFFEHWLINKMVEAAKHDKLTIWENSVKAHWDTWEAKKRMISYAIQKPANAFISNWYYPTYFQERLLKKQFYENM
jgi:hypothetical protein